MQLNAFAKKVSDVCSDSGELGEKFVKHISELQTSIERISAAVTVEYDVLVEFQQFVTSQEVVEWKADLDAFSQTWEDFFLSLNAFHTKAR